MKFKYCIWGLLPFVLGSCVEEDVIADGRDEAVQDTRTLNEESVFYYYGIENRKIALREDKNKIFLKFAPTATKEQFRTVAKNSALLHTKESEAEKYFIEGSPFNMTVLEGQKISSDIINSFKAREEIVSATYMLDYNGSSVAITDEFVVKLNDKTSYTQFEGLAKKYDCRIGKENEFVKNQYMLYVPKVSELTAMQMANLFYETGLFEFSEPNLISFDVLNSFDPYFPLQWGLNNLTNPDIDIDADLAWMYTKGGGSIFVAVLDDGIDESHPDFYWMPTGYDVTGSTGVPGGSLGYPVLDMDNHGTSVAGIIGAMQDNEVGGSYEGISGVAPGCRIVSIRVIHGRTTTGVHIADGIYWAAARSADVINISLGNIVPSSSCTNAINDALRNGRSDANRGCVIVCSSGNDENNFTGLPVTYPANCHPDIIVVGSVDRNGAKSDFSNFGPQLDVVAPGRGIYTTDRRGIAGYGTGNYYSNFSGTSAATPFVSGIAALLLSIDPSLSPQNVARLIEGTAQKVRPDIYSYTSQSGRPNGTWNEKMGHGLVNARSALERLLGVEGAEIRGSDNPSEYTVVSYRFPLISDSMVPIDRWEITGGSYQIVGMDRYGVSVRFNSVGTYTMTAYYTLQNGMHRISKRVNVVAAPWRTASLIGPDSPIANTQVTYNLPADLPTYVDFINWTVTGGDYEVVNDLGNSNLIVKFHTPSQYIVTANFVLPESGTHSISKTVNPTATPMAWENVGITGASTVTVGVPTAYDLSPNSLPYGLTFMNWTVAGGSYQPLYSVSDRLFNVAFLSTGTYIVTASFWTYNYSTNYYSCSKVVNVVP